MKYEMELDEVVALLDAESRRLFGEPLDDDQREAVFHGDEVFAMLDDMEARMGFDVSRARALAAEFYGAEG